jgi:hypothetical protein
VCVVVDGGWSEPRSHCCRGIDTFHQLVLEDGTIAGAPLRIDDEPRYPWRGVSLDTSRHFLPVRGGISLLC